MYKKYALSALSYILKIQIYFKRSSGQWKICEPNSSMNFVNYSKEKQHLLKCLNDSTVYLQEFRSDSSKSSHFFTNKYVRILLNRKHWFTKSRENTKICMKFSQFNDIDELSKYEKYYFTIKPSKITENFKRITDISITRQIFCIFIQTLPIHSLMNIEFSMQKMSLNAVKNENIPDCIILTEKPSDAEQLLKEMNFSAEFNTIGKQFAKFESLGKEKLIGYLNFLWGKKIFNDE